MKRIRQLHLYLGVLFAPAIIFFSLSGGLQTFGWHESEGGVERPAWIAAIGEIHKHQQLATPRERPGGDENEDEQKREGATQGASEGDQPGNAARMGAPSRPAQARAGEAKPEPERRGEEAEQGAERRGPSPLPLKIFVFLMSIGLITTTLLGVYMAFKTSRDRRIAWALLVAGTLLPILLLYI